MPNYRRRFRPGGSYFFTVNLKDRRQSLLVDHVDILREQFERVRKNHPFIIKAAVIMPEHLHMIWTLPKDDDDYPTRWRLIKTGFTKAIKVDTSKTLRKSEAKKKERGIWQRRYLEHHIRDEADMTNHIRYIHYNPVKHGYVKSPFDWSHSSIHQYEKDGKVSRLRIQDDITEAVMSLDYD